MTTYRSGRGLLAAGLILAALTGCGGGGGDDPPPVVARAARSGSTSAAAAAATRWCARARRRRDIGRYLRRDEHRKTGDIRPCRPVARYGDCDHRVAIERNRGRSRHSRRRHDARRVVCARQHRPPVHRQHHHWRRDAQIDACRRSGRHHRRVHRPVGHRIRRRLQSSRGSTASGQRHRAEPAHRRRHRRDHHRRVAGERWRHACRRKRRCVLERIHGSLSHHALLHRCHDRSTADHHRSRTAAR